MAYALFHILSLLIFLPVLALAQTNDSTIAVGSSLTAASNATARWLSPSGDFAFGFQKVKGSDLFLLSIWFDKIPDKTIVWFPNEATPVPSGSRVELTAGRGLVLTDPQRVELWSSRPVPNQVAYGIMNDTGNFEIVRSDSFRIIWSTFQLPSDTMLPTQILERDVVLYPRMTETNFSRGRFQFRFQPDGNLVLSTRDVVSGFQYSAYYSSATNDASNSSNAGSQVVFNETGYMYILRANGQRFDLTPRRELQAADYYFRATLNFDGVFILYYHPRSFTGNPNWTAAWLVPENICLSIVGTEGSGACGYNSVCTLQDQGRPKCECPQLYSLIDSNNTYGGCKPNFTQNCDEDVQSPLGNLYDYVLLIDTDWPTSDYDHMDPVSEEQCKSSCLTDCFCAVAIYRDTSCWKKKLPLSNGKQDRTVNGKAFLKYRIGDLPPDESPRSNLPPDTGRKKHQDTLVRVGSVLLGSSVFVNIVLVVGACLGFFLVYRNKIVKVPPMSNNVEINLRSYSYTELAEATCGFKEELGRGAFGVVYKGVTGTTSKIVVAVKKLVKEVQNGDKEFKAEVNVIAHTHHKNLVKLLGFCDEGDQRLLVYEYMSNGTLASFLFADKKPSWIERVHIALGIARGLSYLHEECSTQIIHCDIKPQNILLDEYFNARIADFGLAKLLMINQSRTHTAIRGTKGYVAPEWFRNTPITIKVDVYSFGVLLLEIISCRRSLLNLETCEEKVVLTDWAWDCFQDRKLEEFVDNDLDALSDRQTLEMFVMVSLWCIQEDPSLRPNMRRVFQMLEGVIQVTEPPSPSSFSVSN